MEKKKLCFCHVVRLCVAERGADFVTLKYTRKVLWWAAGKKKGGGVGGGGGGGGVGGGVDTFQSSATSKETSFRLRIILKSGIS